MSQTTERGNMSTRSNIAIEDPKTKKVKVIYVHSDGYPYGVGKCLVDNYDNRELAELLLSEGTVTGGMIPKLETCLSAIKNGTEAAHILDGRIEHVLLLEVFTDNGVGTQVANN